MTNLIVFQCMLDDTDTDHHDNLKINKVLRAVLSSFLNINEVFITGICLPDVRPLHDVISSQCACICVYVTKWCQISRKLKYYLAIALDKICWEMQRTSRHWEKFTWSKTCTKASHGVAQFWHCLPYDLDIEVKVAFNESQQLSYILPAWKFGTLHEWHIWKVKCIWKVIPFGHLQSGYNRSLSVVQYPPFWHGHASSRGCCRAFSWSIQLNEIIWLYIWSSLLL